MSIAQTWLVRKIGSRNRARDVVEGPAADAERVGLFRQRQGMLTVNHLYALSNPALVSAPAKESFVSVNSLSSRGVLSHQPVAALPACLGSGGVVSVWYLLFTASRCLQAGNKLITVVQITRVGSSFVVLKSRGTRSVSALSTRVMPE